jgi:hypothetical protein
MCQSQHVDVFMRPEAKNRHVSFADPLIMGYSSVPILEEKDWEDVYTTEAERRESIVRAHGYANYLAYQLGNRNVDDDDDDEVDVNGYDWSICNAYQWCLSRSMTLSLENARLLSRVVKAHLDRRGLEMLTVPWLREFSIRRNAVDLVLYLQRCLVTECKTNGDYAGNVSLSEDARVTMALAYRRLSEPSMKFSFLLAAMDQDLDLEENDYNCEKLVTLFDKLELMSTAASKLRLGS